MIWHWRLGPGCSVAAWLMAISAGCGGAENDAEFAHGGLGGSVEAGADSSPIDSTAPQGDVQDSARTSEAARGAAGEAAAGDSDAALGDGSPDRALDVSSEQVRDAAPVDATLVDADASLVDAGADADACLSDKCSGSIGVHTNVCPQIGVYVANPTTVTGGEDVHLNTSPTDDNGDALSYEWIATSGTFIDAHAASTTYHCAALGTATLTFTVSDGKCDDVVDVDVTCK